MRVDRKAESGRSFSPPNRSNGWLLALVGLATGGFGVALALRSSYPNLLAYVALAILATAASGVIALLTVSRLRRDGEYRAAMAPKRDAARH